MALRELRLDNGLRVVLAPRPGPLAMVWVRYLVGAGDDPQEHRGLAHLVEHLLFTGSRHTHGDASEHLYRARALGANATTSLEATDYFAAVPRANVERVLWLESDRMGFMRGEVTRREIALAREVVGTELRIAGNDEHARLFGLAHNAVYPLPHPFFDPADAGTLARVDVAVVEAFLARFVVPANARVIVAGDLPADCEALVRRYFADLPGGAAPVRASVPPSPISREVRLREVGSHPRAQVAWPSPAQWSAGDAAADVAAGLLAHNPGGRLWAEDGPIARLAAQQVSRAGGSLFVVQAEGRPGARADAMLAAIDAAVARISEATAEEEVAVRRMLRLALLDEATSLAGWVGQMQSHWTGLGGPDRSAEALARYETVDVAGFVEATLRSGRRAVVLAEPGGGG